MSMMRNGLRAAALLVLLGSTAALAQTRPEVRALPGDTPRSAIFIGNSFFYYNNGITGLITGLLRGMPAGQVPPLRATLVGIGGSGFDWHGVESYFRPNAVGRYSFDQNNNIVFNNTTRLFDVAVMMDCSQCPVHPQLGSVFVEYARRHAETVRRHGAHPVFFMSWACADKPEMTEQLAEAYTAAGNANRALVIPAGLAFANALRQRPDLQLYIADKRHPSLAGSYLAAATVIGALYGRSVEPSGFTAGLDADTARFLRAVAWETVRAYLGERAASN